MRVFADGQIVEISSEEEEMMKNSSSERLEIVGPVMMKKARRKKDLYGAPLGSYEDLEMEQ